MSLQPNRILIVYGEIALKGRNRPEFETTLRRNVRRRLRAEGLDWPVGRTHDRLFVDVPADAADALESALAALGEVPGIAAYAPAVWFTPAESGQHGEPPELRAIGDALVELARDTHRADETFAVRVNRADKRVRRKSADMEREFGGFVLQHTDWDRVRLKNPDRTFHIDFYPEGAYLYADRRKGIGGLPVYSGGHVLSLLSGGIDSPVAAYLAAKRGSRVNFFHMTASHVRPQDVEDNLVTDLARRLSRYTLRSRLHLIPYTHFDLALIGQRTGYELVLFRRFMMRTAERLAHRLGAQALVAGDSLGQVASQTLENMVTSSRAVDLPVLRPLVTYDKQEIVDVARRIDTFEPSTRPYKDCCALISRNPKTKSTHERLSELEARLLSNYDELIETTLADTVTVDVECGKIVNANETGDTKPAAGE